MQYGKVTDETSGISADMVLKELFSPRRDKFDDFEDPKAFDKDVCLSCRVIGTTSPRR